MVLLPLEVFVALVTLAATVVFDVVAFVVLAVTLEGGNLTIES